MSIRHSEGKTTQIWSWFHRFTYVSAAWVLGVFPNHSIQQWFLFPFPSTIYLIYCIQVGKNRFFQLDTSVKTVWQLLCCYVDGVQVYYWVMFSFSWPFSHCSLYLGWSLLPICGLQTSPQCFTHFLGNPGILGVICFCRSSWGDLIFDLIFPLCFIHSS